jgi:hypothetical protein
VLHTRMSYTHILTHTLHTQTLIVWWQTFEGHEDSTLTGSASRDQPFFMS